METKLMKKTLLSLGTVIALGASVNASAALAPYFDYDLDGVSGGTVVQANGASGSSSDYLSVTSATNLTGGGWVQFNALTDASSAVAGTSYTDTGLYVLFDISVDLISGSLGASNSIYNVGSFHFDIYRDVAGDNFFTQGDASTSTSATVGSTGEDVLLGMGDLLAGDAGLHSTFGASINTLTTFELTTLGADYFVAPDPFFDLAFSGFNSTGNNWLFENNALSIGNATGVVDFARVPEPASLALLGLGLVGLGAARRRKV